MGVDFSIVSYSALVKESVNAGTRNLITDEAPFGIFGGFWPEIPHILLSLQAEVRDDVLVRRLEMDSETGKLVKKSLDFWHYLRIASPDHRRALPQIVLSSQSLAVERRRWTEPRKKIVPQQWRLFRLCYAYIEDLDVFTTTTARADFCLPLGLIGSGSHFSYWRTVICCGASIRG